MTIIAPTGAPVQKPTIRLIGPDEDPGSVRFTDDVDAIVAWVGCGWRLYVYDDEGTAADTPLAGGPNDGQWALEQARAVLSRAVQRPGTRTVPQLHALRGSEVTITVEDGTVAIYPPDGPRLLFATEAFLYAFLGAGGMDVTAVTR
ncbi:MAG: hypothetical protein L6311_12435 [Cellulomonas sp.]|nr:hypothetical protein [Cellulomonas sp.]